jgi:hypothetical protein
VKGDKSTEKAGCGYLTRRSETVTQSRDAWLLRHTLPVEVSVCSATLTSRCCCSCRRCTDRAYAYEPVKLLGKPVSELKLAHTNAFLLSKESDHKSTALVQPNSPAGLSPPQ